MGSAYHGSGVTAVRNALGCGGQLANETLHDRVSIFAAAFETIVGLLKSAQSIEQPRLRNFTGALQREFGLLGAHAQRSRGLPPVRYALYFARFDELAVHPGDAAEHLQRLFAFAEKTI